MNKKYLDNYLKLYISIFKYPSKFEENKKLTRVLIKIIIQT